MKQKFLFPFLLILLCACNVSNKKLNEPLTIDEMDYDFNKIATIDYQPKNTDVILESLADGTLYGSVVDFQKNAITFTTKELFSLTGKELDIIKYNKDQRIYDQIKIDGKLYYLTYVVNGLNQYSELYEYKDGINDILIQKFECKDRLNPPRIIKYNSTFIILNSNTQSLCIYEFNKENQKLHLFDTVLNGDYIGISTAQFIDDSIYIDIAQGDEKRLIRINLQKKEVKEGSESMWFDKFVVTKDFIILYNENKEMIYDKELNLQKTNQIETDSVTWTAYAKDNAAIYVAEDKSIYYRIYDKNQCLKLDSKKEPTIQDFPIKIFFYEDSIIADNLRGEIYSIKIKNIK